MRHKIDDSVIKVYLKELQSGLEIFSSKKLQRKLLLNIENDTGQMMPIEEVLEYIFGSGYEYAMNIDYFKGNSDFKNNMEALDALTHKVLQDYFNGMSLEKILERSKWKEMTLLSKNLLHELNTSIIEKNSVEIPVIN